MQNPFGQFQTGGFAPQGPTGGGSSGFGSTPAFGMQQSTPFGAAQSTLRPQGTPFGSTPFGAAPTTSFAGSTSTTFGGQATPFSQAPATTFGQPSTATPFGAAPSGSVFGQQPVQQGSTTTPFGQTSSFGGQQAPAFSTGTQAFGQPQTTPFGQQQTTPFGQQQTTPFGQQQATPFGQQQTTPFGQQQITGFGQQAVQPFGSTASTAFGQQQQQQQAAPFGSSTTMAPFGATGSTVTPFGAPGMTPATTQASFGASTAFGQQPSGMGMQSTPGTKHTRFALTTEKDSTTHKPLHFHVITMMPAYDKKSFEELRFEDYQMGNKSASTMGGSFSTTPGFSSTPAFSVAPSSTPMTSTPFGTTAFGAQQQSTFPTQPGMTQAFNPTPAFSTTPQPFGMTASAAPAPAFGTATQAPAFGAQPAPFGGTSTPFAVSTSTPAFGASQPFGAASTPAPALGATFSAATSTPFATTTPAFGAPASSGLGAFGTSVPSFQATQPLSMSATTARSTAAAFPFPTASTAQPTAPLTVPAFGMQPLQQNTLQGAQQQQQQQQQQQPTVNSNPYGSTSLFPAGASVAGATSTVVGVDTSAAPAVTIPRYKAMPRSKVKIRPRGMGTPGTPKTRQPFVPESSPSSVDGFIPRQNIRQVDTGAGVEETTQTPERSAASATLFTPSTSALSPSPCREERSSSPMPEEVPLVTPYVKRATPSSPTPTPQSRVTINENAPTLTKTGYVTQPPLSQLQQFTDEQLSAVRDFTIICADLGEVRFEGTTDVRGLDLDAIVDFQPREIAVYPEEASKQPVGQGLNKPAVVTLYQCWRVDRTTGKPVLDERSKQAYRRRITDTTRSLGAELEEYDAERGIWRFRVKHF